MNYRTTIWGLLLLLAAPAGLLAADSRDFRDAGLALYRAGQYSKALVYFKSAVQADPNDWEAYQALGDTYTQLDDSINAEKAYQQSQKIHLHQFPSSLKSTAEDDFDSPEKNNPSDSPKNITIKPDAENTVTQQAEPWHQKPGAISYTESGNGGINRINRARLWVRAELGYNYSLQDELINGANAYNSYIADNGLGGAASAASHGLALGGELGFQLNPYNGFAIGMRVIRSTDYHLDVNFEPGVSVPDYEVETFEPWATPLTLDYYLFLPDSTGRFFLSAGLGYYFATIQATDDYDFYDAFGPTDTAYGELKSGNVGFQASLGREWALTPSVGFSFYGRARYAKISNFKGTLTNSSGQVGTFGLATDTQTGTVDYANVGNINAANNLKYTTVDFTGFEAGIAFTFYTY